MWKLDYGFSRERLLRLLGLALMIKVLGKKTQTGFCPY